MNAGREPPIVLIGIDGLEWSVVLPMLREGELPALAALMERGSFGLLQTLRPTRSPVIWTTIATGKLPRQHGIIRFLRPLAETGGQPELFSARDRKTKAFWNIASDYDKRVAVVGWWVTFPVEPINGVMVAQTNTVDLISARMPWKGTLIAGIPGQVHPAARQAEMMEILGAVEGSLPELTESIFGRFPHPRSPLGERLWRNCLWAFRADETYLRIAERLLGDPEPPDLLAVYFGGPDVVGHRFWRFMKPHLYTHAPTPDEVENFGSVIEDYYAYVDRSIGRIVSRVGPEARVFVISDHGMRPTNVAARFDPDDPPDDVNSAHHRRGAPGVIVAAGPDVRRTPLEKPISELRRIDLDSVASVLDITPTLLALMEIPLGKDLRGRISEALLDAEFLRTHDAGLVATHDTPEWLEAQARLEEGDADWQKRMEQLEALGYLEER